MSGVRLVLRFLAAFVIAGAISAMGLSVAWPGVRRRVAGALACGALAVLWLGFVEARRRSRGLATLWADYTAAMVPSHTQLAPRPHRIRLAVLTLGAVVALGAALAWFAETSLASVLGALAAIYVGGYIAGTLLVGRTEGLALAAIRTVAGLMLTTIGFLLSLVASLPWFTIPAATVVCAVATRGREAFAWPRTVIRVSADGILAAMLVAILVAPIAITFVYMTPGPYPPVLYNVDTAYSLEKTHALAVATGFPPPSLGNFGVRRSYHYGTQAMAAMVARGSGLRPHHALFLIVLPLLLAGVIAAAAAAAQLLAPAIPRSLTVPLLLISVPSLSRSFWQTVGAPTWAATGEAGLWGILSNEGQNVGGDFLILGTIAGMAAARTWGWLLPSFLIGASVIFKTTGGIALVTGFALVEVWRMLAARTWRPSSQALTAAVIFAAVYGAFFLASFDSAFRVALYPFEHMRALADADAIPWFMLDVVWLALPAVVVLTAAGPPAGERGPMLLMAAAPLMVMNMTRLVHVGDGGEGAGQEWAQISHSTPFFAHAFTLAWAGARWHLLGAARRSALLLVLALAVAPVAIGATRYSTRLLADPSTGNDFVNNESLAEALVAIPVAGSLIVTNDIRYPADDFRRPDRQLQLPALFGHQAFSANFSYEPIEQRREFQRLLQRPDWSDAILDAAREYHWTHLLIRKDYVHPAPIPLRQVFENGEYAVYRF